MENKMTTDGEHRFQSIWPLGCWNPVYEKKMNIWQRRLKQYQKAIDSAMAGTVIALMFFTDIWVFLVQLAEYGR